MLSVGLYAFLLSTFAGLSTMVGVLTICCLPKLTTKSFSICLSVSAGVMFYLSFIEILLHSVESVEHGLEGKVSNHVALAYALVTVVIFISYFLTSLIEFTLKHFLKFNRTEPIALEEEKENLKLIFEKEFRQEINHKCLKCENQNVDAVSQALEILGKHQFTVDQNLHEKLGLLTAIVLGIHNFPEGVATYVACAINKRLGLSFVFAIAIHNIPEGIVIAVPVYKATNSYGKAFLYSSIAAIAEPIGSLLAWLCMGESPNVVALGLVFAATCGIMLNVAMGLFVLSFRYDPLDKTTSSFFALGMFGMALSLCLIHPFHSHTH